MVESFEETRLRASSGASIPVTSWMAEFEAVWSIAGAM